MNTNGSKPPNGTNPVPPLLNATEPPILPRPGPPILADKPPVLLYYRLWCGLMMLIYLGLALHGILIARGIIEPPLDIFTELVTRESSSERAAAIVEAREKARLVILPVLGVAIFYLAAAFVKRKPWCWTLGLVAIILSPFPFFLTVAGMIPLLIFWLKPQTKLYFFKNP